MYEDSWYSYVPEAQPKRGPSQNVGHRRKESLLQQPNGAVQASNDAEPLDDLYEVDPDSNSPPEPTLVRRAKSYSSFYEVAQAQLCEDGAKSRRKKRRKDHRWEALDIPQPESTCRPDNESLLSTLDDELLGASQQEYILYHDQLAMTERHLETLIEDTNSALTVLASLSESFRAVEDQTTSFQSQCDDLLSEQKRLHRLADEVGTDLHYYAYLDNVSRRLNAPGASRLVDDAAFGEVLDNLDSCIAFMTEHPRYRDAESYLARYQALMTKALHLLDVGFTARLEKASTDISAKIAASQSESARHALAYGRFEELMTSSYSLIPNIQKVILNAYDEAGNLKEGPTVDIYSNTVKSLFQAYLGVRDRDLKPVVQQELDTLKSDGKSTSAETACRNFVKQCFERSYSEALLFTKIFAIDPQYNADPNSAFTVLKAHHRSLVNPINVVPIASSIQTALQQSDLHIICSVIGWATNEYLLLEYDEEETGFAAHCRELTARLLTEHLWAFADAAFEAELVKSISRPAVNPDTLTIGPVTNGVASSNAYPPVKRAVELLVLFDQSMPKERCQRSSPVVFKIVTESIAALRRAEARIKSSKNGTDPDLFMIKNLLILKNELVSLEIGDVRNQAPGLQHFGQIWETLSPQNLMGFLSSFSSYIPGSSLWSRGTSPSPAATPAANTRGNSNLDQQDASEQLDELLRQSIYAFTQRWAQFVNDARGGKLGAKSLVKVEKELDDILLRAFSNQPEVIAKLREAIQLNAHAQNEAKLNKQGSKATMRG